jgi:predicted dehydrogenase
MSFRAPRDSGNRFYDPALGGGSLLDLGIYPVYLALLMMGEPDSVQAHAVLSETGVDEGCVVILGYGKKKAYAVAESSLVKETDKTAVIWGEKGSITLEAPWNEKPPGIRVQRYDGKPLFYPLQWPGRGFQYEITEALNCVAGGRIESPLHDHARSLALARLLDEIRRQTAIYYPGETGS